MRGGRHRPEDPLACVIGEIDLVRALGLAGIRCVSASRRGDPVRTSRAVVGGVDLPWGDDVAVVETLVAWARRQAHAPVLFYDGDWDLLLVSNHRERLGSALRFVVPSSELVLDLVDKERFIRLSGRLGLPLPSTALLTADGGAVGELNFPAVVKPLTRDHASWKPLSNQKAIQVDSGADLDAVRGRLADAHVEAVVQELVPGPESAIESYHVYVDADGDLVGEFTGRKIRTFPASHGYSTSLEITHAPDVLGIGRDVIRAIGLTGVAKVDFKRHAATGELLLLEVNPRFNLWHHLGAKAGVNLPAAVYADLTGRPRPPMGPVRPGVRWVNPVSDLRAVRAAHGSVLRWIPWALACEAKHAFAWNDPLPLPAMVVQRARGALRRGRGRR